MSDSDEERTEKEWARRYILDPLTEPEPSQLDGPGSSFFNPQRSLSLNCKPQDNTRIKGHRRVNTDGRYPPLARSVSPARTNVPIHHPKPVFPGRRAPYLPPTDWAPAEAVLRRGRSQSVSAAQRPTYSGRSQSLTADIRQPNFSSHGIQPPNPHPLQAQPSSFQQRINRSPGINPFSHIQAAVPPHSVNAPPIRTSPVKTSSVKPPTTRPPTIQPPAVKQPVAKQPVAQQPVQQPVQQPIRQTIQQPAQQPVIQQPAVHPPIVKQTTAKTPAKSSAKTYIVQTTDFPTSSTKKPAVETVSGKTPSVKAPKPQDSHKRRDSHKPRDSHKHQSSHKHRDSHRTSSQQPQESRTVRESRKPREPSKDRDPESLKNNPVKASAQPLAKHDSRFPQDTPTPRPHRPAISRKPPQTHHTQGTADIISEILADRTNSIVNKAAPVAITVKVVPSPIDPPHSRRASISQVQADDTMSLHSVDSKRPVDEPAQEKPRAERKQHRPRRGRPLTDTIDSLDRSGIAGSYHHGGPYDATLAAVNKHKKTSPIYAVKHSNIEAIKATPREFIRDSLDKHVPLQGTGTVPPGMTDMSGRTMRYREGADLMREPDAAGGAYKRWDSVPYHPDDLKGKGEPSYSIEKAMKEQPGGRLRKQRSSFSYGSRSEFELQEQPLLHTRTNQSDLSVRSGRTDRTSRTNRTSRTDRTDRTERSRARAPPVPAKDTNDMSGSVPRQSFSSTSTRESAAWAASAYPPNCSRTHMLGRSDSTGKRLTDGLKRHLGSLRRK